MVRRVCECMCDVHQENSTRLNAWPLFSVELLGHFGDMAWIYLYRRSTKGLCKSIQLFWVITFNLLLNISVLIGVGFFSPRIIMPQSIEHEGPLKGLIRMRMMCKLQSSHSPELNSVEHLREILDWCYSDYLLGKCLILPGAFVMFPVWTPIDSQN